METNWATALPAEWTDNDETQGALSTEALEEEELVGWSNWNDTG